MERLIFDGALDFTLACAVLFVAQLVYALFGFGAGLIAIATLTMFGFAVQDVVVLMLLINLPVEIVVIARQRHLIRWKGIAALGIGLACGVPLGTWLLQRGGADGLLLALGAFLIGSGALFLRMPLLRPASVPRWSAPVVGAVAGVLGALFGTAGPPLIVYLRLQGISKSAFRVTLLTLFSGLTLMRLGTYTFAGLFTAERLWSALAVGPAVLLGAWTGHRIHIDVSEERFRQLVSVALIVIGVLLLGRSMSS